MMDASGFNPHVVKDKKHLKGKAEVEAENQRIEDLALADEKAENYDSHYKRQCTMYKWQAWADLVYTLPDIDSRKPASNEIKNLN